MRNTLFVRLFSAVLYTIALLVCAYIHIVQLKINMILFIQLLRINNSFIFVETLILHQSLSVKSKCQNIGGIQIE